MKKIVCSIIVCILLILGIFVLVFYEEEVKEEPQIDIIKKVDKNSLMEMDEFSEIKPDNIKSVLILKYTEGGVDDNLITDKDEIINIYNSLSKKKIGKKTNLACEDNTTIYKFTLENDKNISIEIECNWVIIGKNRYILD